MMEVNSNKGFNDNGGFNKWERANLPLIVSERLRYALTCQTFVNNFVDTFTYRRSIIALQTSLIPIGLMKSAYLDKIKEKEDDYKEKVKEKSRLINNAVTRGQTNAKIKDDLNLLEIAYLDSWLDILLEASKAFFTQEYTDEDIDEEIV